MIARRGHALSVGIIRSDDKCAWISLGGGHSRLKINHLSKAHIEVDVQVILRANAPSDRQHFGHAKGIVDEPGTKCLLGLPLQSARKYFASTIDAAQAEIMR